MNQISQLISAATGVTDEHTLGDIERCMRTEIFVSTLDWIEGPVLSMGAIRALEIVQGRATAANFVCMEFARGGNSDTAENRALLTDGQFGINGQRGHVVARYINALDAQRAGEAATNRRADAIVSAVPIHVTSAHH